MKLQEKVRNEYLKYIRPLYIKDKCELCGCNENLELHHDEHMFSEQLTHVLKVIGVQNKDTSNIENYTSNELENISISMLGMQVKNKYLTLCCDCHIKEHINNSDKFTIACKNIRYINKYGMSLQNYEESLANRLEEYCNTGRLFLNCHERTELIECLNITDDRGRYIKSIEGINNNLCSTNSIYRVISFRKQINYVEYKAIWKLVKLDDLR